MIVDHEACPRRSLECKFNTVSAPINHHSWLNHHLYKIQINHHLFAQKVHFLGLFWANFGKISINLHLKTLIFLWTAGGLLTRIRYDEICKYSWKIYISFMNKKGITFYQEWKNTQRNLTFQVPKHFSVYTL